MKSVLILSLSALVIAGTSCRSEGVGDPPSNFRGDASGPAKDATPNNVNDTGTNSTPDAGFNNLPDTGGNTPRDTGFNNPGDTGANNPADTGTNTPADTGTNTPADTGTNLPNDGGTNTPDTGMPPTGFDPAARAGDLARAICMRQTRCAPARYQFDNSDETACIAEQTAELNALYNAMNAAIGAGTVTYNSATFNGCVNAYNTADCARGLDEGVCNFFEGNQTVGDPCGFNQECGAANYCQRASLGSCGMCAARAVSTEDCSATPCAPGFACAQVQGQGGPVQICVPDTADENAACGTVGDGFCRGELDCVVNGMTASCVRPATLGNMCSPNGQGAPTCDLLNNTICDAMSTTCIAVSWNAPNQACSPTGPQLCTIEGICNQQGTCDAAPGAGQACNNGRCAPGNFCDGMTCQARLQAGASCTSAAQCESPLDCFGPVNQQTCGLLMWPQCTTPAPDAGVPDTGTPDTGAVGMDAGTPPGDAGMPVDSGVPPAAFDPATRANTFGTAICDFFTRCEPARLAFAGQTAQQCAADQATELTADFSAFAAAITAGRVSFDEMQYTACIAALGNVDCDLGVDADECNFLVGVRGAGDACQLSAECAPGLYCSADGVAVCGMCQPEATLGNSCANDPCVDGAACAQTGAGTLVCVNGQADEGNQCGTVATGFCRGNLQCVEDLFGFATCERPAGPGGQCATDGQNVADCNILVNQACIAGICQAVNWVGPGTSCAGTNACDINGLCEPTSQVCLARPTANQACGANGICADGHFCDGQLCRAQFGQGVTCTAGAQCSGTLDCAGPTGQRSCEQPSWMTCP